MHDFFRKPWSFFSYWRTYTRFLKEVNKAAKSGHDTYREVLAACPLSEADIIRISVSGLKRGSVQSLVDIHAVVMGHRPNGLFCLYCSPHHIESASPTPAGANIVHARERRAARSPCLPGRDPTEVRD